MATLIYSELQTRVLDELNANVSTDVPIATGAASLLENHLNNAYAILWELSGARVKKVASAAAWTSAQLCTGTANGILTDVGDLLHVFATTTAPASISCTTATSVALSSAAAFGSVTAGMAVSGTGIAANTFVASVTDSSNLTLTLAATDATTTSRTFSPVYATLELDRVELSQIHWLRANSSSTVGLGTYATPKLYAAVRGATATAAEVNKLTLEYWPSTTGYYFPIHYSPQFTPLSTSGTPDLNDLESYDLVYLAAISLAPLIDRADFIPSLQMKLSQGTQVALERKAQALLDAQQDR